MPTAQQEEGIYLLRASTTQTGRHLQRSLQTRWAKYAAKLSFLTAGMGDIEYVHLLEGPASCSCWLTAAAPETDKHELWRGSLRQVCIAGSSLQGSRCQQ